MSQTIEEQVRALAERSMAEAGAALPGRSWSGDVATAPGDDGRPGHHRRAWLVAAAALVTAVGVLAIASAWGRSNPDPVITTPDTGGDWAQCPGSLPRRTVEGGVPGSGDGLPEITIAVTDRAVAEAALEQHAGEISRQHPGAVDLRVGPGLGWAWAGENGGEYSIVAVDTYGIEVRLGDAADCPVGTALYEYAGGPYPGPDPSAPLFFLYPPDSTTPTTEGPNAPESQSGAPAGWQLGPAGIEGTSSSFVVRVTRRECAGGQSGDVGPAIVELTDTEVRVTFRPPPLPEGLHTCQGNVPTMAEVDLGEPLGGRVLVDGGCLEDGRLPPNVCERWRP